MKLIVGLGNPWSQYVSTRHNIGFVFLDKRNEDYLGQKRKYESKYKAELVIGEYAGEKLILCKPQTYMNLSGVSVGAVAHFYKIWVKDILVLHDEIDFPTARIAVKYGGSAAWHNGLKSIIEHLKSSDFGRIRIGVDRPQQGRNVADRVLSNFTKEERNALEEKREEIFKGIEQFLQQ